MLILTRKTGQAFRIGEDICISIVEVSGDKVRIGIEAPRDVQILREELVQTVDANQKAAAGADTQRLRSVMETLQKRMAPQNPEGTLQPKADKPQQP